MVAAKRTFNHGSAGSRMKYSIYILIFCCSLLCAEAQTPAKWIVPAEWKTKINPLAGISESVSAGKKIYLNYCASCHGEKGKGNGALALSLNPRPADHSSQSFQAQKDAEIFYKTYSGRNSMPPFKHALSENEIWSVVNFIRVLKSEPSKPVQPVKSIPVTKVIPEKKGTKNDSNTVKIKILPPRPDTSHHANQEMIFRDTAISKTKSDTSVLASKNNFSGTVPLLSLISDSTFPSGSEQNENARRKFLITGSANMNMVADAGKFNSAGFEIGFLPLLLWKPSERLFVESHLHFAAGMGKQFTNTSAIAGSGHQHRLIAPSSVQGGSHNTASTTDSSSGSPSSSSASIMIEYADLVYFLHPNISFTAGIFLSPFGIYSERIHPPWINKLPDAPLGMGHDGQMIPETEFGIQLRGGVPVKKIRANYALYISNGPSLISNGTEAGTLSYGNLIDNNPQKTAGGRIGMLPFSKLNFETGFSFQKGKAGTTGTQYEGVGVKLYAIDFSFGKNINPLKGIMEIKMQYSIISVDKVYYKADPILTLSSPAEDVNLNDSTYRFENRSGLYFFSASYRPVGSQKFWKNTEYVLRYDILDQPCYAIWENDRARWTAGLMYWMDSRSGLKLSYAHEPEEKYLTLQWVIGL